MPRTKHPENPRLHVTLTPDQRAVMAKLRAVAPHVTRARLVRLALSHGLPALLADLTTLPDIPPELDVGRTVDIEIDVPDVFIVDEPPVVTLADDGQEPRLSGSGESPPGNEGCGTSAFSSPESADLTTPKGEDLPIQDSGGSAGHGERGEPATGIDVALYETAAEPADPIKRDSDRAPGLDDWMNDLFEQV